MSPLLADRIVASQHLEEARTHCENVRDLHTLPGSALYLCMESAITELNKAIDGMRFR